MQSCWRRSCGADGAHDNCQRGGWRLLGRASRGLASSTPSAVVSDLVHGKATRLASACFDRGARTVSRPPSEADECDDLVVMPIAQQLLEARPVPGNVQRQSTWWKRCRGRPP